MAYRVHSNSAHGGRIAAARARSDRALTRTTALAGVALSCVCLIAAGTALRGRSGETGSLPHFVAGPSALKIAWVDPAQQAQNEGAAAAPLTPSLAPSLARAGDARFKTASRIADAFDALRERDAHAEAERIPLPPARRKQIAAVIPLPRERVVEKVAEAASPTDAAQTQLFDTEVTGSLGKPLQSFGNAAHAGAKATTAALPPTLAPAAVKPQPVVRVAKPPHKATPSEKLWRPVRVASLDPLDGIGHAGDGNGSGLPRAPYDRQTAVYVITDKKVYMPDGSVLEAHSGLGDKLDDPHYVSVRMRGATPPHVYDLKMREALFHGVEAIRMIPIGGESAIFGRDGILAHTYMLGPNGQSNGCVSFKDYAAFLDAFAAGKITRLAVITRLD